MLDLGYFNRQNHCVLSDFFVTRRSVLVSTPVLALVAACGIGAKSATPDQLLAQSIIDEKQALLPSLASFPSVASQQQAHIDALATFAWSTTVPSTTAVPIISTAATLAELSDNTLSQSMRASDSELRRLLILIASSDAVHAQVTA